MYTDSKYAFHILLYHATIWRERGLMTTKGNSITNSKFITQMLQASLLPSAIVIIHCKSHQSNDSPMTKGNSRANTAAEQAVLTPLIGLSAEIQGDPISLLSSPQPETQPSNMEVLTYLHSIFHLNTQDFHLFIKNYLPLSKPDQDSFLI